MGHIISIEMVSDSYDLNSLIDPFYVSFSYMDSKYGFMAQMTCAKEIPMVLKNYPLVDC